MQHPFFIYSRHHLIVQLTALIRIYGIINSVLLHESFAVINVIVTSNCLYDINSITVRYYRESVIVQNFDTLPILVIKYHDS